MPEGVIIGGWNYVIGAYTVFAVGLAGYALFLVVRFRRARERAQSGR